EAKPEGTTLTGVELQAEKYSAGLPDYVPAPVRPLPFLYQSTGVETRFTNGLDPEPKSRRVFAFHRPETLAGWIDSGSGAAPAALLAAEGRAPYLTGTPRDRLRIMPPLETTGLWPAQVTAVRNLERSLAEDRPRALIQMATGSGKTFTAITSVYRLIKYGGAKRVLFLVDRANLGKQALKEFQQYDTPDDGRKFTELYNVQQLTTNRIDPVARVCIGTIQRLYSMLQGEPELDPTLEEGSQFDTGGQLVRAPVPVAYNPAIPIETFEVIVIDECHRSIYNLWRQVLEYFDAFLIGLTATPAKQTFGFFNQNLVMEYAHPQAVADGVNVDYTIYRIRTRITEQGATVEAGTWIDRRDRKTRQVRWEQLDDELTYEAGALDREVVARDQIRTVVRTFKERLFTEIFPGRTDVPKTLIYAKDDSHADDVVQIVREEFGRGNDFCQKITYKTGTARVVTREVGADGAEREVVSYKSSGVRPDDLLSSFRNSYNPRVVVTVDMIATGTDIKPLEIVMFMRSVKSRNFYEQMLGRGVRVMNASDFRAVTPDAEHKTHFVVVDCVGVSEQALVDTKPLEREPGVSFAKLLNVVAYGNSDVDVVSTLAGRLARLDRALGEPERAALAEVAGGVGLREIVSGLVAALDPDRQADEARRQHGLAEAAQPTAEPTDEQLARAGARLRVEALRPLAANPALRERLIEARQRSEQAIDTVTRDDVLEAGYSEAARERATALTRSFAAFIAEHKDEITALQVLYSRPYGRLRYEDVRALARAIAAPPRSWTPDLLWRAYETLDRSKVRGSGHRILTDVVSLVRYATAQESELVPFPEQVAGKFAAWLGQQEAAGKRFTAEQREWLELIRDHIAASVQIEREDFALAPFTERGGLGRVYQVFGAELDPLLEELNEVLVA
ncbi:MAG TPA: type I restriction-modification enzyme R subunit C-terminal domain-containing protein, partial [Thermomicrobiaceae bacterium]|nr:type I restriction-modification enzyme R subunit C-terminal domain-containing protein [Thermomicrobiaceae bacterium]